MGDNPTYEMTSEEVEERPLYEELTDMTSGVGSSSAPQLEPRQQPLLPPPRETPLPNPHSRVRLSPLQTTPYPPEFPPYVRISPVELVRYAGQQGPFETTEMMTVTLVPMCPYCQTRHCSGDEYSPCYRARHSPRQQSSPRCHSQQSSDNQHSPHRHSRQSPANRSGPSSQSGQTPSPHPDPSGLSRHSQSPQTRPNSQARHSQSPQTRPNSQARHSQSPQPGPSGLSRHSQSPQPGPSGQSRYSQSPQPGPSGLSRFSESPQPGPSGQSRYSQSPQPGPSGLSRFSESPQPGPSGLSRFSESPQPGPSGLSRSQMKIPIITYDLDYDEDSNQQSQCRNIQAQSKNSLTPPMCHFIPISPKKGDQNANSPVRPSHPLSPIVIQEVSAKRQILPPVETVKWELEDLQNISASTNEDCSGSQIIRRPNQPSRTDVRRWKTSLFCRNFFRRVQNLFTSDYYQDCFLCEWFPTLCQCVGRRADYERLGNTNLILEMDTIRQRYFQRLTETLAEEPRIEQKEITFLIDDGSRCTLLIENNLLTKDLLQLLKVKKNVTGASWSVVESWPALGIERFIEDHEEMLSTVIDTEIYVPTYERKYYFRREFLKYEFLYDGPQFFPRDLVLFPGEIDAGVVINDTPEELNDYLKRGDVQCPHVHSHAWLWDDRSRSWKKVLLALQHRRIYTVKINRRARSRARSISPGNSLRGSQRSNRSNTSRSPNSRSPRRSSTRGVQRSSTRSSRIPPRQPAPQEQQQRTTDCIPWTKPCCNLAPKRPTTRDTFTQIADIDHYLFYKLSNVSRCCKLPFNWGICLRPTTRVETQDLKLKILSFPSERLRATWLSAMRLAKYGKQLRENYKAFKNKQNDSNASNNSPEQYSRYNPVSDSLRSRVAMDFTGSVGRIVDDPKEARDIAMSEGLIWRHKWRPAPRPPPGCSTPCSMRTLDGGVHCTQPWFHGDMKRDVAGTLLKDFGGVDGVFLVRESKSNPHAYVLTYRYKDRIFHCQILPYYDDRRNCYLLTLDKGVTKFYDLLQLVEFYQLNSGSLPTRLTHYVQSRNYTETQRKNDPNSSPIQGDVNRPIIVPVGVPNAVLLTRSSSMSPNTRNRGKQSPQA